MLENLTTERRNEKTENLDELSTKEILRIMNEEDKTVPTAIEKELDKITEAIEIVKDKISCGGRLVYLGAGTSGRLGILDAVECVPTFSTTDEVLGIIAGGEKAFVKAVEGAEDSLTLAQEDLKKINFLIDVDTIEEQSEPWTDVKAYEFLDKQLEKLMKEYGYM